MLISNRGTLSEKDPPQSERGFTLLEIVIVVAVLALFVGLAVPTLPDIAGTRIHQNARKVSLILQVARRRAISLRRYYRVELDLEKDTASVSYFGPEDFSQSDRRDKEMVDRLKTAMSRLQISLGDHGQ